MYLAGADPRHPLLSPAVHADLTGLPPMLIQVGTNEVLLDDATRLAARASAAGVDVILDVTADVPHVFQTFAGVLDEADEALDRAALFLRQRIRTGDTAGTRQLS
jgi:acetyl esterase/lipase